MYLYDPAAPPWRQGHIGFMFLVIIVVGEVSYAGVGKPCCTQVQVYLLHTIFLHLSVILFTWGADTP